VAQQASSDGNRKLLNITLRNSLLLQASSGLPLLPKMNTTAAVKHFSWENPIGKQMGPFSNQAGDVEILEVVGVVKDFHSESLRDEIDQQ